MKYCPACGMKLSDPAHTLTETGCRSAIKEFLESREAATRNDWLAPDGSDNLHGFGTGGESDATS